MDTYLIESENLVKKYANNNILDQINIHIPQGKIYGLVGPNGAGKSTLLKIFLNLTFADGGKLKIFDKEGTISYEGLKKTGAIIEHPYFYEDLSARKNLILHSEYIGYYDKRRIDEVLQIVGLLENAEKKVSKYSMGMRQRLAIARAILTKPELLILDEPINALDPDGIKKMRELFIQLNKQYNTTIVISSHILSEMEQLADNIGILNNGKLLKETTINEIKENSKDMIFIEIDDLSKTGVALESIGICDYRVINDRCIQIFDTHVDTSIISEIIVKNGIGLLGIGMVKRTLEDYFFQIINEEKKIEIAYKT